MVKLTLRETGVQRFVCSPCGPFDGLLCKRFFDAVFSFLGIRTKRPAGRAAPPEGSGRIFPAQDSRAPPVQALAALVAAVLEHDARLDHAIRTIGHTLALT
jgi:hypothetical protein